MSHLQPEMIAYLDKKLKDNAMAKYAIDKRLPRILMVQAASACVGIREKTGHNDGPMVELIQKTIGGASGESWCMSFVQTCAAYAALKCRVPTKLFESEHCLTVWAESPKTQRVHFVPLTGAVAIWQHGETQNGHTGIVIGVAESVFHAVEGNTEAGADDPDGRVIREGGGVYFTNRKMSGQGNMKLVGFLKPF